MTDDSKQTDLVTPQAGGWVNAALAVATGQTAAVAAAAGGVTIRTIRRWNRRPAFKAVVEEFRSQLVSETLGRLLAHNGAAVDALAKLLGDDQSTVRLGAAGRLLELSLKARRQLDTEARMEALADQLAALRHEQPQLFRGIHDAKNEAD